MRRKATIQSKICTFSQMYGANSWLCWDAVKKPNKRIPFCPHRSCLPFPLSVWVPVCLLIIGLSVDCRDTEFKIKPMVGAHDVTVLMHRNAPFTLGCKYERNAGSMKAACSLRRPTIESRLHSIIKWRSDSARYHRNRTRVFQWRHSHSMRYRAVTAAEIDSSSLRTVEIGKIDARYRA
jgi:hypothetical protein